MFLALTASVARADESSPVPAGGGELKEIGRVRATSSCTMLSERIAPAVRGLMLGDKAISVGHGLLLKIGQDVGSSSAQENMGPGRMDLDNWSLAKLVAVATHNLQIVNKLIDDPAVAKEEASRSEDQAAADLLSKLRDVAAQQAAAVNTLSGMLETSLAGQMQMERDLKIQGAVALKPASGLEPGYVDFSQFANDAGLPDYSVIPKFSSRELNSSTTLGHTIYDSVAVSFAQQQQLIARAESAATQAVVAAVQSCSEMKGTPTP